MKKPRLCYCPKGTTCYPSDECPNKPKTLENICVCGNRGYSALVNNEHFKDCPNYKPTAIKTYRERAEYLTFINPEKSDMYFAIAEFFGEDEIPPKFKKII